MGRQTATMSPDSVLRQLHTVKEWGEVRPTIERLYVQELRPLSAVMQLMETDYRFKARFVNNTYANDGMSIASCQGV